MKLFVIREPILLSGDYKYNGLQMFQGSILDLKFGM
jgi:hypothetical protein